MLNRAKYFLFAVFIVAFTLPPPTSTYAHVCSPYHAVLIRGSGQRIDGSDVSELRRQLQSSFSKRNIPLDFYELGSASQGGAKYPAVSIRLDNAAGILFTQGKSRDFNDSVEQGSRELLAHISQLASKCPDTKFIIAGYSQGAVVIGRSLPALPAVKIAYIATFGDPNLHLPEGEGLYPPACRGEQLSPYRVFAPDCTADNGILGARKPYEPNLYHGKIGIWCNDKDIMCSSHINFLDLFGPHSRYVSDNRYQHAAEHIASTVINGTTSVSLSSEPAVHNTAFVIDTTGSMSPVIKKYQDEAMKLAKKVKDSGGKIALFEYRDLAADGFEPRMLCDFSCDLETFEIKLSSLKPDGGGDAPESALSAIMHAMQTLEWQRGANKSIILLTDAGFHSPDHNNITTQMTLKKSLEIDPVNFYVVAPEYLLQEYNQLTHDSGGRFFNIDSDEITLTTDFISDRPFAHLPLDYYKAKIGDIVKFDASRSSAKYGIRSYQWDLDGDGIFELETTSPITARQYLTPISSFVQVKITDKKGYHSTMSAHLNVSTSDSTATVKELHLVGRTATTASFTFASINTSRTLLVLDDAVMGFIDGNNFTVHDLTGNQLNIKLIPYNSAGAKGTAHAATFALSAKTSPSIVAFPSLTSPRPYIPVPLTSSPSPSLSPTLLRTPDTGLVPDANS